MGEAAKMSAETGRKYLDWMIDRSDTTDRWAGQDRSREMTGFRPMQNSFIAEAKGFDTPGRQAAAREAVADVTSEFARGDAMANRQLAAVGVAPNSGRSVSALRSRGIERGLAVAGARNAARERVRATGRALRGEAINMGSASR
jgi:hypothetical protein